MEIRSSEPILKILKVERKKKVSKAIPKSIKKEYDYKSPTHRVKVVDDKERARISKAVAKHTKKYKRHYLTVKAHILSSESRKMGLVKTCTMCHKEYGLYFFARRKDKTKSTKLRRSYCRNCRRKMNREYYQKQKLKKIQMELKDEPTRIY